MTIDYPPATWRLILEPHPQDGALNMAADETLLREVAARRSPPTLRLYAWSSPTMTLGRGQPFADADVAALAADGITLLRRGTGGTAVLHEDELSYTVAVTDDEPRLTGGIVESYRGLSAALLYALEKIGLHNVEAGAHAENRRPHSPSEVRSPVCFELPSDYEITVGQRKLFGSAQMRIRDGILQHGTLPLSGDIARISTYLTAHPPAERIRAHAITLCEALGHDIAWHEIAHTLIEGFAATLNLTFTPAPLLPAERRLIDQLVAEKYTNPTWTEKI
ncbi:MAG: lipoate--protein ligase family protein [Anaerolineae bacterium]|nr:lipoate--protein ligase family protein [Anaerolineae bacterium]